MLDLVQTVVSVVALLFAACTIYLQSRAMAASSKLNAAATPFGRYKR